MAAINETRLREALIERGVCDLETAVTISEIAQSVWSEATNDFVTDDRIAAAIVDLRLSLEQTLRESERLQVDRHERLRQEIAERDTQLRQEVVEFRKEVAERDERFRQEIAQRDERLRREIAERDRQNSEDQNARDRRTQWLIGLGFTAFGALASVLAVFT